MPALRREAAGPCGRLFPALDAGITLTAAGEQATVLELAGAYRPPPGAAGDGLGRVILHRVASETARTFMNRVAGAIADPVLRLNENGDSPGPRRHGYRLRPGQHSWGIAMGGILVAGKERGQPVKHLVHGSVSSPCCEYSRCPVVVVPPAEGAGR